MNRKFNYPGKIVFLALLVIVVLLASETFTTYANAKTGEIKLFEDKLNNEVPKLIKKYNVPGTSIALIKDGKIESILNYGLANKKNNKAVDSNTIFQAGSISKSVAAWGVMRLVEEGRVKLDDPVEKYLTRWHLPDSDFNKEDITIRSLLSHTAGLSVHGYSGYLPDRKLPTLEKSLSGESNKNYGVEIASKPGEKFIYSGGGYTILQLVIEEVTNMSFSEYMKKEIFNPLDMNSSSYQIELEPNSNMASSYGVLGHKLPNYIYTEKAAAGLCTTTEDLAKFVIASMGARGNNNYKGVLEDETIKLMKTPIKSGYGLGYMIGNLPNGVSIVSHGGTNRGWRANYVFNTDNGDGLVILTNSDNGDNLVSDISNYWLEYETGSLPQGYYMLGKARSIVKIVYSLLFILAAVYIGIAALKIKKGKRAFIAKKIISSKVKTSIRFAFPIIILATWWIIFYSSIFFNGWIAAGFMPFGFKNITYAVTLWCLAFILTGMFPKTNRRTVNKNFSKKA